jgi:hypothetical protein
MSARAYDEWAENCPMALDQIVVAGTKRTRKQSSKYADDDDDDDAEPSKIAATINKRKTPEKSNEGGTDDEAPTKQPRATTPTSPHPATRLMSLAMLWMRVLKTKMRMGTEVKGAMGIVVMGMVLHLRS